ncbi:MAG TPA: ECF transporter S component [Anaerolineaceae bacterium]|nr:ECF transporter S component [Anaerolineaceae bacterium]
MPQSRTRKIAIAGALSAISVILGVTHWGYIPWFSGASLTIMHIPVIIGAVLEGPIVGAAIGLIFGISSMIQAAAAPTGPTDVLFTNPLLAVIPRLFIGPVAWLVWTALKRWKPVGLVAAGIAGSLTNTILVLGMIGLFGGHKLPFIIPALVYVQNDCSLLIWYKIIPFMECLVNHFSFVFGSSIILPTVPWPILLGLGITNGPLEAGAAALLTLVVVAAWLQIPIGRKKGANI